MRYVVFTQGCLKRCIQCHNAETHALDGGYEEQLDTLVNKWRKNPLLKGITLSGGEPFLQADQCLYLIEKAKETNLDVVIYSGYYYEELLKFPQPSVKEILAKADYLIDGPFDYKLKNLNLLFRGSENQRIIDLQLTKEKNKLTFYEKMWGNVMIVIYDSLTGQTKKFAENLGFNFENITTYEPQNEDTLFLVTRSFNFGEVPKDTKLFLDKHAKKVIGLAVSGNRNWGTNYGAAGDKINAEFGIPLVLKFEGSGMPHERKIIKDWLFNYAQKKA